MLLQETVRKKCGDSQSMMLWDDDDFAFCYTSPRSGTTILAAGNVPFLPTGVFRKEIPGIFGRALFSSFWAWRLLLIALASICPDFYRNRSGAAGHAALCCKRNPKGQHGGAAASADAG